MKFSLIYLLLFLLCPYFAMAGDAPKQAAPPPAAQEQSLRLLGALNEEGRDYYTQIFDYVMGATPAGQTYSWKTYQARGAFIPQAYFKSVNGTLCRPFSETFEVQGVAGSFAGFACKRGGREGWCRLKEGNLLSCALELERPLIENTVQDAQEFIRLKEGSAKRAVDNAGAAAASTVDETGRKVKHEKDSFLWNWWPF